MKTSFRHTLSVACVAAAAHVAAPALANDTVKEQIELALELYQQGEYGAAITELEFAIGDIRKAMAGRVAETFPDAPAGWTAEDVSGETNRAAMMGALGGGSNLKRTYTQNDGDGKMEASLLIDNPMIQGMGAMLSNPALIAAQPNTERIRVGRDAGMVKWDAQRGRAEATLLLDGRILVQVKGSNIDDSKPVVDLLKSWDLKALRAETAR